MSIHMHIDVVIEDFYSRYVYRLRSERVNWITYSLRDNVSVAMIKIRTSVIKGYLSCIHLYDHEKYRVILN